MIKHAANKRFLLLISVIAIAGVITGYLFVFLKPNGHRAYPVDGVLDLHNWNPWRDGSLNLSGNWDFYWNRFLNFQEISSNSPKPDLKAHVPEVWNNYKYRGKNLPGFGYATYRLKIINVPKGMPLALRIPDFSTAYRLYINNRLMAINGKISTNKEQFSPEYRPRVVEFTPAGSGFELIVQAANFTYARGGMWYVMAMGTPEQIKSLDRTIEDKDLFLVGGLLVMVLYYLSIFLLRREDKSSLYFSLMCLMLLGRTVIYGNYFIYRLFPAISFRSIVLIGYISACWFSVFCIFLVRELFPLETSAKILRISVSCTVFMTLLFFLTPISFFTGQIHIYQAITLLMGIYATFCAGVAFVRGRKDSLMVLTGALITTAGALHDTLYLNSIILSKYGELSSIGLFIMMFLQSFVLARRFSQAFRDVNALSQKLLKLDKIKDEFLANTSHELRTPLSGILGIAEAMMRGSAGKVNNKQKQDLAIITGSCRRLANLVNDILDYSKLKHGDIRLNIKPVRMDGLIQGVVKVFQQLSKSREYEVIADLPAGLPPVLADESRVVQILYNLIGNAVKFTTRGYVKVSAKVSGPMLEVAVCDTGEGIPEEKLKDIFKSFEQLDTSLTRKHGGTGLGLSITKQLVELQGGNIQVKSTPGSGSQFYFTLPVTADPPEINEAETAIPQLAAVLEEPLGSVTVKENGSEILLVDDDPVNLHSLGAILQTGGYAVKAVNSGKAALEELGKPNDCSLVILDVMMPQMSGYEVCQRIRESKSHFDLPVLILTAKTAVEDIAMGFKAGANDYLSKPFEPDELLIRVATLVNLKKSVDKAIAAEVAFMQAQIKPHFLFNALNTISSFCDTDPERARELIDNFSNYLRQSFDFKTPKMYVPISSEIELVKSYVTIEKARFGDKLNVEFEVAGIGTVKIPSLSIQPLVENAIRHGIRKKGGSGTVVVSVKNTAAGIEIIVTDDGIGISSDKLEQIMKAETGKGVGLWNIDSRLKKLFGRGLTIESEPGKGAKVMFVIPREISG